MGGQLKTKTLQSEWDDFRNVVLTPSGAGKVQITETRRAFYAGAWAMFMLVVEISDAAATEDEGAAQLEILKQEMERFHDMIGKGDF